MTAVLFLTPLNSCLASAPNSRIRALKVGRKLLYIHTTLQPLQVVRILPPTHCNLSTQQRLKSRYETLQYSSVLVLSVVMRRCTMLAHLTQIHNSAGKLHNPEQRPVSQKEQVVTASCYTCATANAPPAVGRILHLRRNRVWRQKTNEHTLPVLPRLITVTSSASRNFFFPSRSPLQVPPLESRGTERREQTPRIHCLCPFSNSEHSCRTCRSLVVKEATDGSGEQNGRVANKQRASLNVRHASSSYNMQHKKSFHFGETQ